MELVKSAETQAAALDSIDQLVLGVLTVEIGRRGSSEPREKIFEVLIDDPTIAKLQNLAICTTKGARAKLSISKDCCGNGKSVK